MENATNEFLQTLHGMVEHVKHVKHDEEVSIRYMRMMEDERDLLERGRREGRREGIEAFVLDNIEEAVPRERIIEKLVKRFEISLEEAESYYGQFAVQIH